jgi:hypothetical protein
MAVKLEIMAQEQHLFVEVKKAYQVDHTLQLFVHWRSDKNLLPGP